MHIQKLKDNTILLTAPVMIPGMPDCDYDRGEPPLTREQIREFKESFEKYRFIDSEHEITRTGKYRGLKEDSWILPENTSLDLYDGTTRTYPAGTWMLTGHVTDPEAIRAAEKGQYTGWSPSVRSRNTADKYLELILQEDYIEAEALKSQSLSGLIKDVPDPVVLSVSLVRKPCQTGSKLCKLKNMNFGEKMSDSELKTKILKTLGMSEEADVEALKSQVSSLDEKIEELKKDNAEALKSMKEELVSDFKEALSEFTADKSKKEDDDEDDEPSKDDKEKDSEENNSNDESNSDDDEEDKKKKGGADKGSKQGKIHDNNAADKSEDLDTYAFMGRNPDGTSKRR